MNCGNPAPGGAGIAPTWSSIAKDLVGSSLGPARTWFTIGYGIINSASAGVHHPHGAGQQP